MASKLIKYEDSYLVLLPVSVFVNSSYYTKKAINKLTKVLNSINLTNDSKNEKFYYKCPIYINNEIFNKVKYAIIRIRAIIDYLKHIQNKIDAGREDIDNALNSAVNIVCHTLNYNTRKVNYSYLPEFAIFNYNNDIVDIIDQFNIITKLLDSANIKNADISKSDNKTLVSTILIHLRKLFDKLNYNSDIAEIVKTYIEKRKIKQFIEFVKDMIFGAYDINVVNDSYHSIIKVKMKLPLYSVMIYVNKQNSNTRNNLIEFQLNKINFINTFINDEGLILRTLISSDEILIIDELVDHGLKIVSSRDNNTVNSKYFRLTSSKALTTNKVKYVTFNRTRLTRYLTKNIGLLFWLIDDITSITRENFDRVVNKYLSYEALKQLNKLYYLFC